MITRIELTNFMSHEHTVIEPAAGLTVLVGPNNVGKSAVVAALQILCHNENSTYVLRHDTKECSVKVETDDGHVITWRRKNSPSYVVDGQVFDRLKQSGQPEELHRVLRLPNVDAGGDADFDIHFGTQKSPIFLLGSSAANAARFFASSSDAIRLVGMQKRHKEKLADAQREKNALEARSKELNAELELLEPAVDIDRRLEIAERVYDELVREADELVDAAALEVKLRSQTSALDELVARSAALADLPEPPRLTPTEPLVSWIATAERAEIRRAESESQAIVLGSLSSPPDLADETALANLAERIATLSARRDRNERECRALTELPTPPGEAPTDGLADCIDRLQSASETERRAQQRTSTLARLASLPELADDVELRTLISAMARGTVQIDRHQCELQSLAAATVPPAPADTAPLAGCIAQLVAITTEMQTQQAQFAEAHSAMEAAATQLRTLASHSTCSLCGAVLDPERVVARAAAGLGDHDHD